MAKMRCHSLTSSEEISSQSSKRTNCGVGHITYIGFCTKWEEDSNYKVIFLKAPNIILGVPDNILTSLKCTLVDVVLNSTISRQS